MRDDQIVPDTIGVSMDTRESLRLASQSLTIIELPDYKLNRELGRGSFGTVWAATREKTGQQVAIKIVDNGANLNWDFFRRELGFLRELEEHPYTLTLLDAQLDHDPPFIVMPLADGGSLEDSAKENKPSVAQVESWMRQMAEGLVFIHRKGVIHCDFKPSNVLLSSDNNIRIADLGQARRTGHGQALGTIGFMAPEQCLEESRTTPSISWDVHGFGATAYWLLTGKIPRLANLEEPTLTAYIKVFETGGELLPVRQLNPNVDKELAAIVESCLRVEPEKRILNMDAILEDLDRRAVKEPLNCKKPWSLTYIVSMALQRRTVQAGIFVFLLAALAATYGWYRRNENLYQNYLVGGLHAQESGRLEEAYLEWLAALQYRSDSLPLKQRLSFMELARVFPHKGKVTDMLLQDDDVLITGSEDGEVAGWDTKNGEKLFSLKHKTYISKVAVDQIANLLVTASWDGSARVFDLSSKELKATLENPDGVQLTDLVLANDAKSLVTADFQGGLKLWTITGESKPLETPAEPHYEAQTLAVHPSKPLLAAIWGPAEARLWDLASGRVLPFSFPHEAAINELRFSLDGSILVSGSDDNTASVWDVETGRKIHKLEHDSRVNTILIASELKLITGCEDGAVYIWDLNGQEPEPTQLYHRRPIRSLDLDPSGKLLAVGTGEPELLWSDTEANGTVVLWNLEEGFAVGDPRPHDGPVEKVLFNTKDSLVLSASGSARKSAAVHPGSVRAWKYFAPDSTPGILGKRLKEEQVDSVRLDNGVVLGHGGGIWINQFDINSDLGLVATAGEDMTVRLWQFSDGAPLMDPLFLSQAAKAVRFGPSGEVVATAACDSLTKTVSQIRLWEVETGYPVTPPLSCPGEAYALEFSPDGRELRATTETAVYSWPLLQKPEGDWARHVSSRLHSRLDFRGSVVSIPELSKTVMTKKVP